MNQPAKIMCVLCWLSRFCHAFFFTFEAEPEARIGLGTLQSCILKMPNSWSPAFCGQLLWPVDACRFQRLTNAAILHDHVPANSKYLALAAGYISSICGILWLKTQAKLPETPSSFLLVKSPTWMCIPRMVFVVYKLLQTRNINQKKSGDIPLI